EGYREQTLLVLDLRECSEKPWKQPVPHARHVCAIGLVLAQEFLLGEESWDLDTVTEPVHGEVPPCGLEQEKPDVAQHVSGVDRVAYEAIGAKMGESAIRGDDAEASSEDHFSGELDEHPEEDRARANTGRHERMLAVTQNNEHRCARGNE